MSVSPVNDVARRVTFTGADFSIQPDGVCRLNPELARRVAQLTLEQLLSSER